MDGAGFWCSRARARENNYFVRPCGNLWKGPEGSEAGVSAMGAWLGASGAR